MSFSERKFHLVGTGGAGMSGLAVAARELGATVSGSDRARSSYTDRLIGVGVDISIGHDAANVPEDAEIVVSTAISDDNPEVAIARERGQNVLHRSDLLQQLVELSETCIAIAGTHGKTTTTAMIAHVLTELDEDPSFFVGGEIKVGGRTTNAHVGHGPVVVVEADESDGSFLKLDPEVAVVTNVELDHHSKWSGGLPQLMSAFTEFARPAADLIVWRGQPELTALSGGAKVTGFGIGDGEGDDLIARDVNTPADPTEGTEFLLGDIAVKLGVRGDHNVLNALAALASLRAVGVEMSAAAPALAGFHGAARRFEFVGDGPDGSKVYDDYAHHPTEVRAALSTARQTVGSGRVVAVFQPHLFSRTQSLAKQFGEALALADVIVVTGIYPARELQEEFPGVSGWQVATATADAAPGAPVHYQPELGGAAALLHGLLHEGDLCITIGAGDVHTVGRELVGA